VASKLSLFTDDPFQIERLIAILIYFQSYLDTKMNSKFCKLRLLPLHMAVAAACIFAYVAKSIEVFIADSHG